MRKTILIAIAIISIIGCAEKKKKETTKNENHKEELNNTYTTQNYAVVFKWTTKDEKLVEDNTVQQADQLLKMWKENIVENVYYDSSAKVDKFSYFPNITFFIKAQDKKAAESILNNLTFIKKNIASYTIYPVGNLWLKRNIDAINKKGITKSYVSVWTTKSKPSHDIIMAQNDSLMKLWKQGTIENAYFDIQGTQVKNNKTDFVLFVNSNTEEEAKSILNNLPFIKNNIASYKLHQVGVFWMGIHNN